MFRTGAGTVREIDGLLELIVDDSGRLVRDMIDREHIHQAVNCIVSSEGLISRTDKMLQSMEALTISLNKTLEEAHCSAVNAKALSEQISATIARISKTEEALVANALAGDQQVDDPYQML